MLQTIQIALAFLPEFMQIVAVAVGLIEALSEATGDKGPAKKVAALTKLKELYPPEKVPAAIRPYYDSIAGAAIDILVMLANKFGFFTKAS